MLFRVLKSVITMFFGVKYFFGNVNDTLYRNLADNNVNLDFRHQVSEITQRTKKRRAMTFEMSFKTSLPCALFN